MQDVGIFVHAVGLKRIKDIYSYEYITYCKVNSRDECGVIFPGDENNLMTVIENLSWLPKILVFGVLGNEQHMFFKSKWPLHEFVEIIANSRDIENSIPPLDRKLEIFAHVFHRARQMEMFQDVLKELMTDNNLTIKDLMIDDKIIEKPTIRYDKEFYENVSKIKLLLYATELSLENPEVWAIKAFDWEFIVFAPVKEKWVEDVELQTIKFFLRNSPFPDDFKIGVFGDEQHEFFGRIADSYYSIVDVSNIIPEEIEYICRNVNHAKYHAGKIWVLQNPYYYEP